jgi:hypothetical protein
MKFWKPLCQITLLVGVYKTGLKMYIVYCIYTYMYITHTYTHTHTHIYILIPSGFLAPCAYVCIVLCLVYGCHVFSLLSIDRFFSVLLIVLNAIPCCGEYSDIWYITRCKQRPINKQLCVQLLLGNKSVNNVYATKEQCCLCCP